MVHCEDCKYFEGTIIDIGLCRRYAPRPTVITINNAIDQRIESNLYWPKVHAEDKCGEAEVK